MGNSMAIMGKMMGPWGVRVITKELHLARDEMAHLLALTLYLLADKRARLFSWTSVTVERRNKLDACFIFRKRGAGELRLTHSETVKLTELMGDMLGKDRVDPVFYCTWDGVRLSVIRNVDMDGMRYTVRKQIGGRDHGN